MPLGLIWLLAMLVVAVVAVLLSRSSRERTRRALARAALAELLRQRLAQEEQRRVKTEELERERARWSAAESAADPSTEYHTSVLLRPNERIGYATSTTRIITHKVGHKSDRISLRTGTSTGTSRHESAGSSNSGSFGIWGAREGGSQSVGSGSGQHTTQRTSSGSGHTYSHDDIKTEVVDSGQLVLTNQRVVFLGNNQTLEIPMEKVIGFHFPEESLLVVDYAKRPTGECYTIPDPLAFRMAMTQRLHEPGFDVPPKPEILQGDR